MNAGILKEITHPSYKVGDTIETWWSDPSGGHQNVILAIFPYIGRYPQWFSAVVRVVAYNTKRGWIEMAVE